MEASVARTVPIDRLIDNLSRFVKEHPEDARGYHSLGRVHSLAFVKGADSISVDWGLTENPPKFKKEAVGFYSWSERKQESNLNQARQHLEEAIRNYHKATVLDSSEAIYFLGLGWLLQQGAEEAPLFGAPPIMPDCRSTSSERYETLIRELMYEESQKDAFGLLVDNLPCAMGSLVNSYPDYVASSLHKKLIRRLIARAWEDSAIRVYRKAIELSFDQEYKRGVVSGSAIYIEAADNILEILNWSRTAEERTAEDLEEIARLESMKEKYRRMPMAISPMIFPLKEPLPCSDLIDTTVRVCFDMDGMGGNFLWPWVKPNTAFLVWDPSNDGQITSGRQLFGNVTWWMFWENGYQPIAALDDDGNGWLEGAELDGIAIWHDTDSDAVSDRGEVSPANRSIHRICVAPNMVQDGQPASSKGLVMRDGRVLPTIDWTPVGIPDVSRMAVETEAAVEQRAPSR